MSKVTVKLVDEQIDAIIIRDLKNAYKSHIQAPAHLREPEITNAIEVMLRYYMIESKANDWINRQKKKVGV